MASKETNLEISNWTGLPVKKIEAYDIDSYDWDGDSRPDKNLVTESISRRGSVKKREEINSRASRCMVGLKFIFSNGDTAKVKFDQKHAGGFAANGHTVYEDGQNTYNYILLTSGYNDVSNIPTFHIDICLELK